MTDSNERRRPEIRNPHQKNMSESSCLWKLPIGDGNKKKGNKVPGMNTEGRREGKRKRKGGEKER